MRDPVPPHVRRRWLVAQAGLVLLIAAPFVLAALDRTYLLPVMTRMLAYGLAAAALDLVRGYGGLVSFGHGAFLGTGAYVAGVRCPAWCSSTRTSMTRSIRRCRC